MSKAIKIAAGLAVVPVLAFSTSAFADSVGDLEGGADIYQVRNTLSSTYGSTASVACGEAVKYSVKLSDTDYSPVSNIIVKASLTSGAMTASGTASDGSTTTTSGNVTVTTAAGGTLDYVAGSTQLVTPTGTVIKALSDGVTTTGVNAGTLNGSTKEYVQFQAKLDCTPTPPTITYIQVCDLTSKKIVTIDQNNFDSSKYTKDLTQCAAPTTVTTLPNTGAGNVVGIFAGVVVAGFVASRLYLSRKLAHKA